MYQFKYYPKILLVKGILRICLETEKEKKTKIFSFNEARMNSYGCISFFE